MNERSLIIIGASGHGKVVADIASLTGYKKIVFLDDNKEVRECGGYPVIGSTEMVQALEGDLFVAIGSSAVRQRLMDQYKDRTFPVLCHPAAVVAASARIGLGSVVMAGAVINPEAVIGRGAIVNTGSSIDHDCVVGDFVHVAVGAHLCGTVTVGSGTWIGAGATVSNNVSVCDGCIIGAGGVVIRDVTEPGTYVGVPARRIR